jgi:hypothetical protein
MEKRYDNSLKDLLEKVAFEGTAAVAKWRVCRWYGQATFSVTIRRDIRERWEMLVKEDLEWDKAPTLRIADANGKIHLFSASAFFKDKE